MLPADLYNSLPLILLGGLPREDLAGKALASLLYQEANHLCEQASVASILICRKQRFMQEHPVPRWPPTAALKDMLKRIVSSSTAAHLVPALNHLGKCAMSHSSAGLIHICKAALGIVQQDCLSCLEGSSLLLLRAAGMDLMPFEARAAASHTLLQMAGLYACHAAQHQAQAVTLSQKAAQRCTALPVAMACQSCR